MKLLKFCPSQQQKGEKQEILKANAVSYSKLKASLGDSPLDIPYTVVSFTMFTTKVPLLN